MGTNKDTNGYCICVNCGIETPHQCGIPCHELTCAQCGENLMKKDSYHHLLYKKSKGDKK